MQHSVFISYSHVDRETAETVCSRLEGRGIGCWLAPRNILPGADWGASIIDGIDNARVMVLVFSSASNKSHQVRREVERAVAKNVTIIPLKVEAVALGKTLEYFLATTHWLDASGSPVENHLGRLAEGIEALLATTSRDTSGAIEAMKLMSAPPPRPGPAWTAPPPQAPAWTAPPPPLPPRPVSLPPPLPAKPAPAVSIRMVSPAPSAPPAPVTATVRSKVPWIVGGLVAFGLIYYASTRGGGSGGPEVVGIDFPPVILATGQNVQGVLRYKTGGADVLGARFSVVDAISFTPFEIRAPAPGRGPGQVGFVIRVSLPQRVTLEARAVDAAGATSRPYRFTFEARRP